MDLHTRFQQVLAELTAVLLQIDAQAVERLLQQILSAERIFVAGVGRSGLIISCFAMRLMHLGLTVHVVGHVTTPAISARDLLLIGSASGATQSLLVHATSARQAGARLAVVTAMAGSALVEMADIVLMIPAPTPKADPAQTELSVQPMASLFEQVLLITLDSICMLLMERLDLDESDMFLRHANLE